MDGVEADYSWDQIGRRAAVRFLAVAGICWLLLEVTVFFLKINIPDNYQVVGYISFIAVALTVALTSVIAQLKDRVSKLSSDLAIRTTEDQEALAGKETSIRELRDALDLAHKQDVTTALVAEVQQAFSEKRWEEVIKIGAALSRPLWTTGRYPLRIQLGALVESAASFAGNTEAQSAALIDDLGWTKVALGRTEEGKEHIVHGLRLAQQSSNAYLKCKANRHLSGIEMRLSNFEEAERYLAEAKAAMSGIKDRRTRRELEANFLYVDGVLLQTKRDFVGALSNLENAQQQFLENRDRDRAAKCFGAIGDIYLALKNVSAAKDSYRNGFSLAQQISRKDAELKCLDGLGRTALAESNPGDAGRFFAEAARIALQLGDAERSKELSVRAANLKG
jgi:tetratricopeptide (TPR) repeat protein